MRWFEASETMLHPADLGQINSAASVCIGRRYGQFGFGLFLFYSCSLLMKIGNHLIIHLGACKLAPRQTRQRFSLQRPRPPRAPSIMSSCRPNVELSSSSFLCNPRSKVPRKREWILRSNKHTFSDGRN